MKIRYKQIAGWPFMGDAYKVGRIYEFESDTDAAIIAAYPHLFQKLNWWEDRPLSFFDAIKHVKDTRDNKVYNVEEFTAWLFGYMSGVRNAIITPDWPYGRIMELSSYHVPVTTDQQSCVADVKDELII